MCLGKPLTICYRFVNDLLTIGQGVVRGQVPAWRFDAFECVRCGVEAQERVVPDLRADHPIRIALVIERPKGRQNPLHIGNDSFEAKRVLDAPCVVVRVAPVPVEPGRLSKRIKGGLRIVLLPRANESGNTDDRLLMKGTSLHWSVLLHRLVGVKDFFLLDSDPLVHVGLHSFLQILEEGGGLGVLARHYEAPEVCFACSLVDFIMSVLDILDFTHD